MTKPGTRSRENPVSRLKEGTNFGVPRETKVRYDNVIFLLSKALAVPPRFEPKPGTLGIPKFIGEKLATQSTKLENLPPNP